MLLLNFGMFAISDCPFISLLLGNESNDLTDFGRHSPAGAQKLSSTPDSLKSKFHKLITSKYYPGEHLQMISLSILSHPGIPGAWY